MEAESKPINNELKRKNSDIDTNDRPAKRARTDSDGTVGESGFSTLSKDILTEISYHLDVYNINAMFSASKRLRNHISWHASETEQFWRQMVLKKYPGYELRMPDEHEEDDTLPWRDIFIGTQRKLIPPSDRLVNFMQLARPDPKQSEADLLYNTRKVLAKLEFQNGLLDQVENFLDDHPTMWLLWESRFLYTCHRVLPGVEFSAENYKWDVTCTTPVQLTIIGKNGQALMIDTLTSSFACYWGYGFHSLIKYEVMSVFEVSSAMRIFDLPKEVIPKTPHEDNNEDKIIKKLLNSGWKYINKVTKEEWKQLLDQIGLSDVDVDLFVKLIRSAAFPAANRTTSQFYTETTGYYGTTIRHFDNRGPNKLPGVGGEVDWGLAPVKTGK